MTNQTSEILERLADIEERLTTQDRNASHRETAWLLNTLRTALKDTERVPTRATREDRSPVLISGWNGVMAGDGIQYIAVAIYAPKHDQWFSSEEPGDLEADDPPSGYYLNVTHWMPLPKPPTTGTKDGQ